MSGLFGYVANRDLALGPILVEAARRLTYRGSGSVGAATFRDGLIDLRKDFGKVDAVTIAVPTVAHFDVAKDFIEQGVHVLLEKPITDDPASARSLIDLAKRRSIVFQIGQLARFSAATLTVRDRITAPLYIESYRIAPFKPRGIDVNVILDVMIHDIDLILSLVNAPVESVDAVGAPVLSASEDIANARVRFANGCVATITASRVSTKAERKMRIFEPDSYIGIDFLNRTVTIVRKGKAVPGAEFPEIIAETQSYEEVDALEYEISAFVDSVRTGAPPLVTGEDGLKALEAAITITDSLRRNRERLLSDMAADASRAQRR